MKVQQLVSETLRFPQNAIAYHISQQLTALYPNKAILEGSDSTFNFEFYAQEHPCKVEYGTLMHNQILTAWDGMLSKIYNYAENASFQVTWQGYQLDILVMSLQDSFCKCRYYWVLADSQEIANKFFTVVCEWNTEVRSEILVFEDGFWSKNLELFESIQNSSFENLILQGTLKKDIQDDLVNFFAAKTTYEDFGIPWKRGILFIGPPGNGKTHAVKALINKLQQPCLYVKSLKAQYDNPHHHIREVFQKARQTAPCLLVLEDLDSLIGEENRSFFLNELDGFAANTGLVILATTNHPERIDPAILDRPSRFDRKYHFELPGLAERIAYINLWNSKFKPAMRLSDAAVTQVATMTDSFSFAYLKELFLSSMMHWMRTMTVGAMDDSVISQIALLRKQMNSQTVNLAGEENSVETGDQTPSAEIKN